MSTPNLRMTDRVFQITLSSGWTLSIGVSDSHHCQQQKPPLDPRFLWQAANCEIACFKNEGRLVDLVDDTVHGHVDPDQIGHILTLLGDDDITGVRELLSDEAR